MRACLPVVLALASCWTNPPPQQPAPPPVVQAPPAPPPRPQGQYCWISGGADARKSGCTVELEQCQRDADEMRKRDDGTTIAQECTRQSPVHCYVFESQETPLCYASMQDCNEGRERMADFGATTECEPRR